MYMYLECYKPQSNVLLAEKIPQGTLARCRLDCDIASDHLNGVLVEV